MDENAILISGGDTGKEFFFVIILGGSQAKIVNFSYLILAERNLNSFPDMKSLRELFTPVAI